MEQSIQKIRCFHHHVCNMPVHSVKEAEKNSYKNIIFFLSHSHLSLLIWWIAYQQTHNELTHISSTNYLFILFYFILYFIFIILFYIIFIYYLLFIHWNSLWFPTVLTLFSMFQNQKEKKSKYQQKVLALALSVCLWIHTRVLRI